MPLDMTGPHRYNRQVHYRRYLNNDNQVTVICVQDFDYHHYDESRFLDLQGFDTELEGQYTPLRSRDVLDQMDLHPNDMVVLGQGDQLLEVIRQHRSERTGLFSP